MTAEIFIPIILASLALGYASFTKNKQWTNIAFVIWLVLFVLTFLR